jgi:hypothetical protein
MHLLCVGLCVASGLASIGRTAQPQPEPVVPSDAAVIRAAGLPPGTHGDVSLVKELVAGGRWKCTVYYSTLEPVPLPWGGWVPVAKPRVREVFVERPGRKA